MNRPFTVFRCAGCRRAAYPRRLACARCGGSDWTEIEASTGEVTEITARMHRTFEERRDAIGDWDAREAVHLASVRLDAGPIVTARTAADVAPRQRVSLISSSGAPVAIAE